jgi:hypothetical protein
MYMCEHIGPPHACAVMPWGGYCTLSLAWEGAIMMPLQYLRGLVFAVIVKYYIYLK